MTATNSSEKDRGAAKKLTNRHSAEAIEAEPDLDAGGNHLDHSEPEAANGEASTINDEAQSELVTRNESTAPDQAEVTGSLVSESGLEIALTPALDQDGKDEKVERDGKPAAEATGRDGSEETPAATIAVDSVAVSEPTNAREPDKVIAAATADALASSEDSRTIASSSSAADTSKDAEAADLKDVLAELRLELAKERDLLQQERDFLLKNKSSKSSAKTTADPGKTNSKPSENAGAKNIVSQAKSPEKVASEKKRAVPKEREKADVSEVTGTIAGQAKIVAQPEVTSSIEISAPQIEERATKTSPLHDIADDAIVAAPTTAPGVASGANFVPVVCNLSPTGAPLYDARLADQAVMPSRIVNDKRFWRMARTVISLSKEGARNKWFPDKEVSEKERRTAFAIRFREALVEFGPTFIKLGQFLSVRRDFLTQEMADELVTLQDKVPPFEVEIVQQTIGKELGQSPEQIFAEFDYEPIASASIGQVHRAQLKDGRSVVVKVQRPDLAQRFYQDLGYMRTFIRWGRRLKPDGEWDSWLALSDEFGRTLFSEIDYLQEGKNADRMRVALKDQERVRVPRVIWRHTGRHVLTLEYAPGTKIDQLEKLRARGFDLEEIGNNLIYCYLEQVLIHGFFHADPHAGNLAVDDDGKIIIYDFGMMGEISAAQRVAIAGCVTSVIDKKGENVAAHLVELGVLKEDAAKVQVIRTLTPFIDYYSGKTFRELDFTNLERDIDQIALERALRLPANLAYLLRAGSSLEGIARTLQPNFSFVEAAKPFIQRWLLTEPTAFGPLLKVFFRFGQEAYRNSAAKLSAGREILGLGKRKSKLISHTPNSTPPQRINQEAPLSASQAKVSQPGAKSISIEKEDVSPKLTAKEAHAAKLDEGAVKRTLATDDGKGEVLAPLEAVSAAERKTKRIAPSASASQKISEGKEIVDKSDADFRQQIYLLETKVQKSFVQQITLSVCGLVVVFLFFVESYYPEYRSYATYFLIGNGVMGAIIMWHLVVLLGKAFQEKR